MSHAADVFSRKQFDLLPIANNYLNDRNELGFRWYFLFLHYKKCKKRHLIPKALDWVGFVCVVDWKPLKMFQFTNNCVYLYRVYEHISWFPNVNPTHRAPRAPQDEHCVWPLNGRPSKKETYTFPSHSRSRRIENFEKIRPEVVRLSRSDTSFCRSNAITGRRLKRYTAGRQAPEYRFDNPLTKRSKLTFVGYVYRSKG